MNDELSKWWMMSDEWWISVNEKCKIKNELTDLV